MTKVKICGITNLQDALFSVRAGADALGFNFYEKSPRYILAEKTRKIVEWLPEAVLKVGVFVDESLDNIIETAEIAGLNAIQLHGDESADFVTDLRRRTNLQVIKAFRVSADFEPEDVLKYDIDAVLLDAFSKGRRGGTGKIFDWNIAKKVSHTFPKMYLAGGLSDENVAEAIVFVHPYGVDACSKLESEKGVKDQRKLEHFIHAAKQL